MRTTGMQTTIEDVAKAAGVSITTVSRVINNNYPVKNETRRRVNQAIKDLDFTPNSLARGLIHKKNFTIGVLVPSITNLFFPEVVNGIQDYMQPLGYNIFLCDTAGNPARELDHLRILNERRVDGIICVDPRTENIRQYEKVSQKTPLVIVNGFNEGVSCHFVLSDQEAGATEAFGYLLDLGHTEIAFVRGLKSYSYDLKEDIYRRILSAKGLEVRPENIITIEKGNSVQTTDLAEEAVYQRLGAANPPTAVFACNDWMAVGTLHAAQRMELEVPRDISVIGYDNIVISQMTLPKLTTVDQNMRRLGELAAERLTSVIANPGAAYTRTYVDARLTKRESCAAKA